MKGSLNKVMLIGNLGKDPEMVHFENGGSLARFSLATSESYKTKAGEQVDRTDWHNVVLRNALAGIGEKYLKKGDKVYVEGKIRTRSYEQNGVTKYTTEIFADTMTMLGGKPNAEGGAPQAPKQESAPSQRVSEPENLDTGSGNDKDDLPF